eukprot:scpid75440/ scgid18700/ 
MAMELLVSLLALCACIQSGTSALTQSMSVSLSQLTHNWDCISCKTNSMLAGNFGHLHYNIFNMSDTWWIDTVATSYAAVAMNDFLRSQDYNGTGENGKVTVARALKKANPGIKLLMYQSAHTVGAESPFLSHQLLAKPDWWMKDDYGNIVWARQPSKGKQGIPMVDLTVPAAQTWFANIPLSYFHNKTEAKELCDGIFVDSANFRDVSHNISDTRYRELFAGKMKALKLAQNLFTELNGGEVWGNAAMEAHQSPESLPPDITWNTTLSNFNGAFDEMFGSFSTEYKNGSWNTALMERTFETVINASSAGHTIVIHAYPGPATVPFASRGTPGNDFIVPSWNGQVQVPTTAEGCREAAAKRLVESLAPFLIVANERVFLGYAWLYSIEDGYIPCKAGVECGMPSEWYPEFTRPLGPPKAAATRQGTVWTREFEHASVYVDLANRSASRVTWN